MQQAPAQDSEMKCIIEMFLLAPAHENARKSDRKKLPTGNEDLLRDYVNVARDLDMYQREHECNVR